MKAVSVCSSSRRKSAPVVDVPATFSWDGEETKTPLLFDRIPGNQNVPGTAAPTTSRRPRAKAMVLENFMFKVRLCSVCGREQRVCSSGALCNMVASTRNRSLVIMEEKRNCFVAFVRFARFRLFTRAPLAGNETTSTASEKPRLSKPSDPSHWSHNRTTAL